MGSGLPEAAEFLLEFADPALGPESCLAFAFGPGFRGYAALRHLVVGLQIQSSCRVPPTQLSLLPAEAQAEHRTVPPEVNLVDADDFHWLIGTIDEAVARERSVVISAPGGVEPPVFGYSESCIVGPFIGVIILSGGRRALSQGRNRAVCLDP